MPCGLLRNGKSYLIISDHLGSVRLVVDTHSGRIEQSLDYDVWGRRPMAASWDFNPLDRLVA